MQTETMVFGPRPGWKPAAILAIVLLPSCGAGSAVVAAGSGGSGGAPAPTLESFVVVNPKVSPSELRLEASRASRVELFYDLGLGAGEEPMTRLVGVAGNEVDLAAGMTTLTWDFSVEPGIDSPKFRPGVRLVAKRGGIAVGGGELELLPGLGNDPPEILSIDEIDIDPDEGEASGTTGIEFTVADSSDDVVSVKVEFDIQGDVPDAGWQLARPDLLDAAEETPEFGVAGVQVSHQGTTVVFHWDTDAGTDLKDLEREVRLRLTPDDGTLDADGSRIGLGQPKESAVFRVDNNAPPIVQFDSGPLVLSPDEARGIPVRFRVIDEESDPVEMIFQWRREGEEFPELPRDAAALDAILLDASLRREHHVCTEFPRFAEGRLVTVDATTVRLPELALGRASAILATGVVGRALELLRPPIPEPIMAWSSNPLAAPVAVLPLDDGLSALVLDGPGPGRLREIELATGAVVRDLVRLGPGLPSAMAPERVPGEAPFAPRAVLVALDDAGVWRIERVDLASGTVTELVQSDGSQPGPVRGIASLGTGAAVFTVGAALLHLDYSDPLAPRLATLFSDLATPWGVSVDPLRTSRIYVAERDAVTATGTGRIDAIELDTRARMPVVVRTEDLQPAGLERPTALALERNGARMSIVTEAPGGGAQLVGLDLGPPAGNVPFPIGPPLAGEVRSLTAGPGGQRLAVLPGSSELLAGGGLEQRRTIVAHEAGVSGQRVRVDAAFAPPARAGQAWRIPAGQLLAGRVQRTGSTGLEASFTWSSRADLPSGGAAFLRAVARDEELGLFSEGTAPKTVRAAFDVAPVALDTGSLSRPSDVAVGDLDGDGDLDLVSANFDGDDLTVFFQESPGSFVAAPALGDSTITNSPQAVAIGDLDGDGDLDLVTANFHGEDLTLFFQGPPGTFTAGGTLGSPSVTRFPQSVAIGDLDGDGDMDIVSANGDNSLTVFFQVSPGSFGAVLVLDEASSSVAIGDVDGDGGQDLVSGSRIFFQDRNAPRSFDAVPFVLDGSSATCVALGDLDGDGDMDIVSGRANANGGLTVFFQDSPRSFDSPPLALGVPGSFFAAIGDLDGDGDHDLVFTQSLGIGVFLQDSPGSFVQAPGLLGIPTLNLPVSVVLDDLDGDGDLDLVSANHASDNLTLFFQESFATLGEEPLVLGTGASYSVALGDLDGDGDPDLVSANSSSLGFDLTVFFQGSLGTLGPLPLSIGGFSRERSPTSVAVGDLDGDGDMDLASANSDQSGAGGRDLTVLFQDSPGSFASDRVTLGGPSITRNPRSIALGDLDGDGDLDLVSANRDGGNLTVFHQRPLDGFDPEPLVLGTPSTRFPSSVALGDLDGDGDLDLVCNQSLTVFLQESPADFRAEPVGSSGFVTESVALGDLDGDGDLDLVSADYVLRRLAIYFQESPGSLGAVPRVLGVSGPPFSVALGDLDGDGDLDLASANRSSGTQRLTVFFQESPGRFGTAPLTLFGGFDPFFVTIGDLDGDGDSDLVSTSLNGRPVSVFWGGR